MNRSILVFSLIPFYGGGEKYICDLVTSLSSMYTWYLAVCSHEIVNILSATFSIQNIKLGSNNGRSSRIMSAVSALTFAIRKNVDTVVLNGMTEVKYAFLFRLCRIKTVGIIHTSLIAMETEISKKIYFYNLRRCDSIVSISRHITEHYPKDIVERTTVVYNSFPLQNKNNINRTVSAEISKVLYVGRIEQLKGIEDIYALADLFQSIQFDLLGAQGFDSDSVFFRCKPGNVNLRGFCTNVFDYYLKSELFLFPSRSEGMPFVLLEAASVGLPIIASRIPAHLEFAEHIDGIWLYDPGDMDQLVTCFEALSEPSAREEAGSRIYKSYLEFAKNNDFVGHYRGIFDRL